MMAYASPDILAARHARIRDAMARHDLDAFVVTHLPNVFYLTNFTGTAAIVMITRSHLRFLTDFRYASAVDASLDPSAECPGTTVVRVKGAYDEALVAELNEAGIARAGFEAAHLTVSRFTWLTSSLERTSGAAALVATEGLVERVRVKKDAHELATLREAGRRISRVATEVLAELAPGRTERDVAGLIEWRLRQAGFARPAFETIVASGPRAALPHARASDRVLQPGDLVVLDFGGVYDGYCVDLTRTVSLGPPGAEGRRVYAAVSEAQRAAIEAVRPGVMPDRIDGAARDVLARHGLGEAFGHGTGHGLGIEVHEDPRIAQRRNGPTLDPRGDQDDERIEAGMVFTIEPGAYLPGWGGVRIEDDVLVTEQGCELLTDVTRELVVV